MQNFKESSLSKNSEFIEPDVFEDLRNFIQTNDYTEMEQYAVASAKAFGATKDFYLLFTDNDEERGGTEIKLIQSFHKNLHLLVEKTWVEKNDETLKEQNLIQLDSICKKLEEKQYVESYSALQTVLNSAIKLMFGEETTSDDDFAEYALRIDPGFGTFYCFIQSLPSASEWNIEKIRSTILLEMCFIANY